MTNRLIFIVVLGSGLVCAGAAWLSARLFLTPPAPETGGGPQVVKPAVPDPGKPPEAKPKPSIEIKRGVGRPWLDTLTIEYAGGYLDAWIDMEIYGVRDELSLTIGHLRESYRWSHAARGEPPPIPKGSVTVVILHLGSHLGPHLGSYEGRAVPECLINAESSWLYESSHTTTYGQSINHPMPDFRKTWGRGRGWSRDWGGSPFNPTEYDPDATTFVAFWWNAGAVGYSQYWGDWRSADPELWDDHGRKLGVPAARSAAAMVGLGGPFGSAFAAVPVAQTYQDLYLYGAIIQVKYRFLTEREVGLLRAHADRGEAEIERMIRGFRRMPNRVEVPGEK